jgi:hypothetical protein
MPSRDYFTYDESPDGQSIEVDSPRSTQWDKFQSFFEVKGVILSEKPEGPAKLAKEYGKIQGMFQRTADQLDAQAHRLREAWSAGKAAWRFFWFAGATLYGLDHWVEHFDEKIERLNQLSSDIADAHAKAEELEQQFKAEYLAKIPADGAFYGFPPKLSRNNPEIPDDEEAKLKAQIAAIYAEVHEKYLRLIIEVGKKLGEQFIKAAEWMGSAGKVPVAFQGADQADPWRPYTADPVSPTPVVFQFSDPLVNTPPSMESPEITPLSLIQYDGPGPLPPGVSTEAVPPYGDSGRPSPSFPAGSTSQHGFGPTVPSGDVSTPSGESGGAGTGGALLGRGFLLGVPPLHPAASPRQPGAWSATTSAGSGPPGATLAGRFGEPLAQPPSSESLPTALSARGAQPLPAVEMPSPTALGSAVDGPMGAPVAAATGWHQVLSARAMMPPPETVGGPRPGRERAGALGEGRRRAAPAAAAKPSRGTGVDRGGAAAAAKKSATSEPRPTIRGTGA